MSWVVEFKQNFPELTKFILRGDLDGMCNEVSKLKRALKKEVSK